MMNTNRDIKAKVPKKNVQEVSNQIARKTTTPNTSSGSAATVSTSNTKMQGNGNRSFSYQEKLPKPILKAVDESITDFFKSYASTGITDSSDQDSRKAAPLFEDSSTSNSNSNANSNSNNSNKRPRQESSDSSGDDCLEVGKKPRSLPKPMTQSRMADCPPEFFQWATLLKKRPSALHDPDQVKKWLLDVLVVSAKVKSQDIPSNISSSGAFHSDGSSSSELDRTDIRSNSSSSGNMESNETDDRSRTDSNSDVDEPDKSGQIESESS